MGVTIKGHLDVPPERLSRAEPGCRRFDLREDPATPGRLLVEEEFADADAFATHKARAEASAWGQISRGILRHLDVTDTDT